MSYLILLVCASSSNSNPKKPEDKQSGSASSSSQNKSTTSGSLNRTGKVICGCGNYGSDSRSITIPKKNTDTKK
jgi:hypothetical protein